MNEIITNKKNDRQNYISNIFKLLTSGLLVGIMFNCCTNMHTQNNLIIEDQIKHLELEKRAYEYQIGQITQTIHMAHQVRNSERITDKLEKQITEYSNKIKNIDNKIEKLAKQQFK